MRLEILCVYIYIYLSFDKGTDCMFEKHDLKCNHSSELQRNIVDNKTSMSHPQQRKVR